MNYLDTSALIKRFVAEWRSPLIQTIVARNGTVATKRLLGKRSPLPRPTRVYPVPRRPKVLGLSTSKRLKLHN